MSVHDCDSVAKTVLPKYVVDFVHEYSENEALRKTTQEFEEKFHILWDNEKGEFIPPAENGKIYVEDRGQTSDDELCFESDSIDERLPPRQTSEENWKTFLLEEDERANKNYPQTNYFIEVEEDVEEEEDEEQYDEKCESFDERDVIQESENGNYEQDETPNDNSKKDDLDFRLEKLSDVSHINKDTENCEPADDRRGNTENVVTSSADVCDDEIGDIFATPKRHGKKRTGNSVNNRFSTGSSTNVTKQSKEQEEINRLKSLLQSEQNNSQQLQIKLQEKERMLEQTKMVSEFGEISLQKELAVERERANHFAEHSTYFRTRILHTIKTRVPFIQPTVGSPQRHQRNALVSMENHSSNNSSTNQSGRMSISRSVSRSPSPCPIVQTPRQKIDFSPPASPELNNMSKEHSVCSPKPHHYDEDDKQEEYISQLSPAMSSVGCGSRFDNASLPSPIPTPKKKLFFS